MLLSCENDRPVVLVCAGYRLQSVGILQRLHEVVVMLEHPPSMYDPAAHGVQAVHTASLVTVQGEDMNWPRAQDKVHDEHGAVLPAVLLNVDPAVQLPHTVSLSTVGVPAAADAPSPHVMTMLHGVLPRLVLKVRPGMQAVHEALLLVPVVLAMDTSSSARP